MPVLGYNLGACLKTPDRTVSRTSELAVSRQELLQQQLGLYLLGLRILYYNDHSTREFFMSKSTLVSDFAANVETFIPRDSSWASLEARKMVALKDDLQSFIAAGHLLRECPSEELSSWALNLPLEVRQELSARGVSSLLLIHDWIEDMLTFDKEEDRDSNWVRMLAHYCCSRDKLGDLLCLLEVSGGEPYENLRLMLEHLDHEAQHQFLPTIRGYTYDGYRYGVRLTRAHQRYPGNWWAQIVV